MLAGKLTIIVLLLRLYNYCILMSIYNNLLSKICRAALFIVEVCRVSIILLLLLRADNIIVNNILSGPEGNSKLFSRKQDCHSAESKNHKK